MKELFNLKGIIVVSHFYDNEWIKFSFRALDIKKNGKLIAIIM